MSEHKRPSWMTHEQAVVIGAIKEDDKLLEIVRQPRKLVTDTSVSEELIVHRVDRNWFGVVSTEDNDIEQIAEHIARAGIPLLRADSRQAFEYKLNETISIFSGFGIASVKQHDAETGEVRATSPISDEIKEIISEIEQALGMKSVGVATLSQNELKLISVCISMVGVIMSSKSWTPTDKGIEIELTPTSAEALATGVGTLTDLCGDKRALAMIELLTKLQRTIQ